MPHVKPCIWQMLVSGACLHKISIDTHSRETWEETHRQDYQKHTQTGLSKTHTDRTIKNTHRQDYQKHTQTGLSKTHTDRTIKNTHRQDYQKHTQTGLSKTHTDRTIKNTHRQDYLNTSGEKNMHATSSWWTGKGITHRQTSRASTAQIYVDYLF